MGGIRTALPAVSWPVLALLTVLELQFIAQQALGEGVWGNDQQVINPEAVGGQGLTGLHRQ